MKCFAMGVFCVVGWCEERRRIEGVVLDSKGAPVAEAFVEHTGSGAWDSYDVD